MYLCAIKPGLWADAANEALASLVNSNSRVGLFPEFPRALEFLTHRMHYCQKRSYCGGVALARDIEGVVPCLARPIGKSEAIAS